MRVGMNPLRIGWVERTLPPHVPVVSVLVHLPDDGDYHAQRWEIVTNSLILARQNAGVEHYFVVWDNGSSELMREWLVDEFCPDQIVLSDNIGVLNAMRRLFGMYHDSIVAYGNDDIIYYPEWLGEQIRILESFPNVGTVSGCVTRYYTGKADDATVGWAGNRLVGIAQTPPEWDMQHNDSIGGSGLMVSPRGIPLVEYNGVRALIGGTHCQFVCRPGRLLPIMRETTRYMEPLFEAFDMRINAAGLLRLLTTTRRTRHIGNVMTEADRREIYELVGAVNA